MPELKWLALARADLLEIVDYISDDNPDAAQRVRDDIEAKVAKLADFSKIGRPGRIEGTREWHHEQKEIKIKKHGRPAFSLFPYGLDYLVDVLLHLFQKNNLLKGCLGKIRTNESDLNLNGPFL